ncbi:uncharacterized protein HMPREF1541_07772 [Cyphellophora europaea CBS 101466]|uniref:Uncharacterized protein n=1 Tax=Cyphellophora europaea (strain CBS 101466) TaxID=1220924 RepID=W2RQZ7_CYPE1|nr:uncharacterized protein HMPREF1541_07772 [Cyphellophora europaea CBS 101466]ETN38148.1 hypothetical protein HMPREF1541_07772 [Cyphellophora europaea CBS 101466]
MAQILDESRSSATAKDPANSPVAGHSSHVAAAPVSPTQGRKHSTSLAETLPLDHPARAVPVHSSLPTLNLLPDSAEPATAANVNPLTLAPFTPAELASHKYDELRKTVLNDRGEVDLDRVRAEQEEAIKQIKTRMEERERKESEIDKEIAEKEKFREVERKILRRRMGGREGG